MSYTVIVGSKGRMSGSLQKIFQERSEEFRIFSENAPADLQVQDFKGSRGVIDFSAPESTEIVIQKAVEAGVPLVCGTTGWKSEAERDELFSEAAKKIPIVVDSNFSLGIEILSRGAELLAKNLPGPFFITDLHHQHKKDAPSGTAFKLAERIRSVNPEAEIEHRDFRLGEIPGEHRVLVSWENETMEFTHRASSRDAFSYGSIRALDWAQDQKPGLYKMSEVLQ